MDKQNRIVGITCSTFDLLHAGHVIMLEECKKYCDYLICALQVDPTIDRPQKNKPIQSLVERYLQLDAVKHVDKIIPYNTEEELITIFSSLKFVLAPNPLNNLSNDSIVDSGELVWKRFKPSKFNFLLIVSGLYFKATLIHDV